MNLIYEQSGTNTFLTYEVKEGQVLDTMCLGTLKAQKIPGYAPVSFTQMDDTKYIRYNVTSKISVEELFQGTVSKKKLLAVLKGVVVALLATDEYIFLNPEAIIMDSRYIFIDVATCETVVICLPIEREENSKVNHRVFLRNLLTEPITEENDDQYVATLLRFINKSPKLSLIEFQELLEQMSKPVQPVAIRHTPPADRMPPNKAGSALAGGNDTQKTAVSGNRVPNTENSAVTTVGSGKSNTISPKHVGLEEHFGRDGFGQKDQAETKKGLFANLFGSKKNEREPPADKSPKVQVPKSPSQQPDIGRGANYGVKIPRPQGSGNSPIPQMERNESRAAIPGGQSVNHGMGTTNRNAVKENDQRPNQGSVGGEFPGTVVLVGNGEGTTVLVGGKADKPQMKTYPYLIHLKTKEKVEVNKQIFRIGKEHSQVDYTIMGNTAVSRSHAKIITNGTVYQVEDTNSLNHTYVNGKVIPSGVPTRIEHGYRLTFANEEYEFKTH